jgi:uncharacterized membrane protein
MPRGSDLDTGLTRLPALDWMRGFVMVLMAVDHSSEAFNAGRLFTDSALFYKPGTPLPAAQFLTRFITHLCAPTFVFLAGTSLAFGTEKQRAAGSTELAIDRFILLRGLVIASFEVWISWFVMPKGKWLLQVLYAIGTSYLCMVPLRRLPDRVVLALGLLLVMAGDAMTGFVRSHWPDAAPLSAALTLVPAMRPGLIIGYPTVPWLAIMLLGWAWGRRLVTTPLARSRASRELTLWGAAAFSVFGLVRGINAYGNAGLLRQDSSIIQWLHVSKYPPCLAYTALELGVCCFCLAGLSVWAREREPGRNSLLMVLGQTPLFFYLLHFPLLVTAAHQLGLDQKLGLGATYTGAALVVATLYPCCLWYRGYKARHPSSFTRYV